MFKGDRMELELRFAKLATRILPGEGFSPDEIAEGIIRSLCWTVGDKTKVIERVKEIADQWFSEDPED
jgi:hypothetical protein